MRGSDDTTWICGRAAVPVTSSPVTRRVVTAGFGVPSSSWFGSERTSVIVSVAVTAYCCGPVRATVSTLIVPSIWAT